jgi:uncharacterized membrane protein YphA (DoxX/SURF4 family)
MQIIILLNKKERHSMNLNLILWIVQAILAAMFLMAGMMKAFQYERAKATLPWVKDVPKGLVTFIGVSEMLGGVGVVLPLLTGILPWLTPLAAAGLMLIMLLAMIFDARRGEGSAILFNLVLFALAGFVLYGRFALLLL